MNVLITMAGKSQRFRDAGYDLPKFLLNLGHKTVIEKVVECFSEDDTFHFIISRSQKKRFRNLN